MNFTNFKPLIIITFTAIAITLTTCIKENNYWLAETRTNSIDSMRVTLGGEIVLKGPSTTAEYGICYSTNATPTISDSTRKCGIATELKAYSTTIDIIPAGTWYYSSYIKDQFTQYGDINSFTLPTQVYISNWNESAPYTSTTNTIRISNNIPLTITSDATWAKPNVSSLKISPSQKLTLSIESNTGQTDRTATITIAGTGYCKALTITQKVIFISTATPSNISQNTATSGGTIIANTSLNITARGVCWATTANPTVALTTKTTDGTGAGTFTSSITGMLAGTTYYIRAYATTAGDTTYGEQITLTTLAALLPTLTTTATDSVTQTTAKTGGTITSDGGAPVTARGVCWSTTTGPTKDLTTKTTSGTGTGAFTIKLSNLQHSTLYYVRAYAINSAGTAYGTEFTFTTKPATVPDAPTIGTATAGNAQATVTFTAPANNGGSAITSYTVTSNPGGKTGTGTASPITVTGLTNGTTYTFTVTANNSVGTSISSTASTPLFLLSIGADYLGGKVAYILQIGDPGYVAGKIKGIIAAPIDQSASAQWGCSGTTITGADGIALGTGNQNTIEIVTGCVTVGIAAKLCSDLVLGGYSDWYLPSKDELNKLYLNKTAIGGFVSSTYWSSSEESSQSAYLQDFSTGSTSGYNHKEFALKAVRAIRSF